MRRVAVNCVLAFKKPAVPFGHCVFSLFGMEMLSHDNSTVCVRSISFKINVLPIRFLIEFSSTSVKLYLQPTNQPDCVCLSNVSRE